LDSSSPKIKWDSQGTPYSVEFDDMYFCAVNGYEDASYIFCGGNYLEERFKNLDPKKRGTFFIVETGFGTGLIFCVAWKLWAEHAPSSWILNFISVEKFPLPTEELERALSVWPIVKLQADELISSYKIPNDKIATFKLGEGKVQLTIVFDDIVLGLERIAQDGLVSPGADALFLDGFSPRKNPQMWAEEVFAGLRKLSKAGTTLATFTVAGWVRRNLESQGFKTEKKIGYGCKNEMLIGSYIKG
jgi:tRNA 5-methylaminomethyl-2-thiouridine biosynthesis bifunctional protein